jgi:hypothetical protein
MASSKVINRNLPITTRLQDILLGDKSINLKESWLRINKSGSSPTRTFSKWFRRMKWFKEAICQLSPNWSQNESLEAGLSVSYSHFSFVFGQRPSRSEYFVQLLCGEIKFNTKIFFIAGYVFEAYDKESDQTVAVKRTQKAGEYVSREYEVLNRLRECKNVVKMLDIYYSRSEDGKTAQNLVFEYCNKNLEEII